MLIPARTTLCQKGCCTVTWCPFEISWATTIHRFEEFEEFEAGFDDSDMFWHLIVDPSDLKWEQTCPGALYVALSRAKKYGDLRNRYFFPMIFCYLLVWFWYFHNSDLGRPQEEQHKEGWTQSEVSFNHQTRTMGCIHKKMEHTTARVFSDSDKKKIRAVKHTQAEVRERIATIITTPNISWEKRKKQEKYAIPRNYFGQYAWYRYITRYVAACPSMMLNALQQCSHFTVSLMSRTNCT